MFAPFSEVFSCCAIVCFGVLIARRDTEPLFVLFYQEDMAGLIVMIVVIQFSLINFSSDLIDGA